MPTLNFSLLRYLTAQLAFCHILLKIVNLEVSNKTEQLSLSHTYYPECKKGGLLVILNCEQ